MKKIFLLATLSLFFASTSCKNHTEKHEKVIQLTVTKPLQTDTTIYKTYVAQVRSYRHIEMRAIEKGYLQNSYVDEGQFVKKGQLMFQIMPIKYEAEVQKALADANYEKIEYLNTKALADSDIVSQNELALAKAKYNQAKAELKLAQVHLGFTSIEAPFDGIMGRFEVRLGSLLDEGDLLTSLSDNSKVWIYFNVPEAEYLNYKYSNPSGKLPNVRFIMANGEEFASKGVIETIEADFNNETGNIAFRATFQNPKSILRHGETGNILVPSEYKNAILIPQKATFDILNKKYVYVVDEQHVVHAREVFIQDELPHLYVISKGITKNDEILIEGLRKVKNGDSIKTKSKDFHQVLKNLNTLFSE